MQSPPAQSPLLSTPGAVPADGPDTGVAAHYGDPFAEQRALSESLGLVDRSHRGVIRIAGPDRLSWVHSLTTQALENLAPGTATEALILSPNGHIEHHLTLTDDGTHLWAHVEPGTAGALLEFLESMRFMLRVDPADVTDEFAVVTLMGPDAGPATGRERGRQLRPCVRDGSCCSPRRAACLRFRSAGARGGARGHVGL